MSYEKRDKNPQDFRAGIGRSRRDESSAEDDRYDLFGALFGMLTLVGRLIPNFVMLVWAGLSSLLDLGSGIARGIAGGSKSSERYVVVVQDGYRDDYGNLVDNSMKVEFASLKEAQDYAKTLPAHSKWEIRFPARRI